MLEVTAMSDLNGAAAVELAVAALTVYQEDRWVATSEVVR
jgi:hypothetical protein